MKNTVKPITTIFFFFLLISCENKPASKVEQFSNSGNVVDYVGYADEMIIEGYIRDSVEAAERGRTTH
ncbi:hypothetical protein GCM10011514_16600 [Emticicia aquatilis]|uniref:Uncharacterized protein n=1 Tax=Emticicia aquatilis TaxID=1537369 RepID=A0A917DMN4_9BACT|nr:hypothetical protein [Emticicia aquatilis]GGD53158.1 hypothetical protein GCM10011514_16600 [Emticicia aquatilis]